MLYLAVHDSSVSGHARRHLLLADQDLRRVSHLARQTLGFYRDTSSPQEIDVARTLDEVLLLYERKHQAQSVGPTAIPTR